MPLEEISDETYWERRERLMRKFANDPNEHNRAAAVDLAVEFATAEMLDEIHLMLRQLLGTK
jgi:hypothetical protein